MEYYQLSLTVSKSLKLVSIQVREQIALSLPVRSFIRLRELFNFIICVLPHAIRWVTERPCSIILVLQVRHCKVWLTSLDGLQLAADTSNCNLVRPINRFILIVSIRSCSHSSHLRILFTNDVARLTHLRRLASFKTGWIIPSSITKGLSTKVSDLIVLSLHHYFALETRLASKNTVGRLSP